MLEGGAREIVTYYAVKGTIKYLTEQHFTRRMYNTLCGIDGFKVAFDNLFRDPSSEIQKIFIIRSSYAFLLDIVNSSERNISVDQINEAYRSKTSIDLHHQHMHNETPLELVKLHQSFLKTILQHSEDNVDINNRYEEILSTREVYLERKKERMMQFRTGFGVNDAEKEVEEAEYAALKRIGITFEL